MNIIRQFPLEMDKRTIYKLTQDEALKMSDCVGQQLEVEAFVIYDDVNAKGENVRLLSVLNEGKTYTTSSKTFIEKFEGMAELFAEDGFIFEVTSGLSKGGRTYYSCTLV